MQPIEQQPTVTWEKALMVLSALVNIASVREVQVVGSLARGARGNDLDVVVVVDFYTYVAFLKGMWEKTAYPDDYYDNYCEQRVETALAVIKMTPAEYGWLKLAMQQFGAQVDIHVMPEGWQQNVNKVQTHLPHQDAEFVRNIAGDARRLRTSTGPNDLRVVVDSSVEVLAH